MSDDGSLLVMVLTSPGERDETPFFIERFRGSGRLGLYLARNGVLWLQGSHRRRLPQGESVRLFVHGPDLEARGLSPDLTDIETVGASELARLLMERYTRSVTL